MKPFHQLSYAFALILFTSLISLAQSDKFNVSGTWYYFSTEENKMMRSSEYTAYTFSEDGSVSKRTLSEIDKGTYTIDAASSTMTLKFVYSSSDIRSESWRIVAVGKARIFYRRNISQNMGFEDDLLYIRQKSTTSARKKTSQTNVDVTGRRRYLRVVKGYASCSRAQPHRPNGGNGEYSNGIGGKSG